MRRPTDPSTLHSFDSVKPIRIATPPSSNVTVPSSITGSFDSTRVGPKNPSILPIPDESEVGSEDGMTKENDAEEDENNSSDESPGGGHVDVHVQRFTTALED